VLTIYIVPRVVGNLVPKAREKSLGTRLGSLVVSRLSRLFMFLLRVVVCLCIIKKVRSLYPLKRQTFHEQNLSLILMFGVCVGLD